MKDIKKFLCGACRIIVLVYSFTKSKLKFLKRLSVLLLLFLFIPSFLSFLLFWHNVEMPAEKKVTEDGRIEYIINPEKINRPNIKNTIRKIFQSPFDLSYYSICIQNNTYARDLKTNENLPTVTVVTLSDKDNKKIEELRLESKVRRCTVFKAADALYFSVSMYGPAYSVKKMKSDGESGFEFTTNLNFDDKAKPVKLEQAASSIIFYIAWLSIITLYYTIKKHCKEYIFS